MNDTSDTSPVAVTAGAIIRDGHLLAARRRTGARRGGKWELPGGKVEPGEGPEQCLARELREELGVEVAVGAALAQVIHAYPDIRIQLTVYRCELLDGEPQALEHAELSWLAPAQVKALDWSGADAAVIKEVLKNLP